MASGNWTSQAARDIAGTIADALHALADGDDKALDAAVATGHAIMDAPESRQS